MAYPAASEWDPLTGPAEEGVRSLFSEEQPNGGRPKKDDLMRCYFHLVNGHDAIRDTDGLEVADLDQAHAEALETLHALAQEDEEAASAWAGWRLEVSDTSGAVLFSISLDEAGAVH